MKRKKLRCEDESLEEEVEKCADLYFVDKVSDDAGISVFFEHGQWWVLVHDDKAGDGEEDQTYSVHDAVGGDSVGGFSFERV